MKKLLFALPLLMLIPSCSATKPNDPLTKAYGKYSATTINMSTIEYDYCELSLNKKTISTKYKINGEAAKAFETSYSCSLYDDGYSDTPSRYLISFYKTDNAFPLVNWANIIVNFEDKKAPYITAQSTGIDSESGSYYFMLFNKNN